MDTMPIAGSGALPPDSASGGENFAAARLWPTPTADIYELIVERHRAAATVATSKREPIEWLALMADPLLAQSAIDRQRHRPIHGLSATDRHVY